MCGMSGFEQDLDSRNFKTFLLTYTIYTEKYSWYVSVQLDKLLQSEHIHEAITLVKK